MENHPPSVTRFGCESELLVVVLSGGTLFHGLGDRELRVKYQAVRNESCSEYSMETNILEKNSSQL